jgi:hypothetical protein
MEDAVKGAVFFECPGYGAAICHVTANQRRIADHRFVSGAQIVDDHGRVPRPLQISQGVGADVAGTAGDE